MPDPLFDIDPTRIVLETAVARVDLHEELASTNDLALDLGGQLTTAELPLLVVARRQTGGRGRGPNRWWADHGALTFSLVVDTVEFGLAPRRWPRISLATGIAVAETVMSQLASDGHSASANPGQGGTRSHTVQAKWPNDVFLAGRKVAGILAENVASQPQRLVIGIGLNVNNSWREAPAELAAVGTSLMDAADRPLALERVLVELLQRLHQHLAGVADETLPLADLWQSICMLSGRTVTVAVGQQRTTGVCHGINEDGALLLMNEGGMQECVAGVVADIL